MSAFSNLLQPYRRLSFSTALKFFISSTYFIAMKISEVQFIP